MGEKGVIPLLLVWRMKSSQMCKTSDAHLKMLKWKLAECTMNMKVGVTASLVD